MTQEASMSRLDKAAINPLIDDSSSPEDTIYNIQAALSFISNALVSTPEGVKLNAVEAHGMSCLINCCGAALASVNTAEVA